MQAEKFKNTVNFTLKNLDAVASLATSSITLSIDGISLKQVEVNPS